MRISHGEGLAGAAPIRHNSKGRSYRAGKCSQGGVKIPTGGKGGQAQARERLPSPKGRVSRFGVIPKPTVKVRMKENGRDSRIPAAARRSVCAYAGPEIGKAMNQMLQDATEAKAPSETKVSPEVT